MGATVLELADRLRTEADAYLSEFDFRYSTRKMSDTARMNRLMGQTGGKRLTYKRVTA